MTSFAERFPEISDIRVKVFSVRGAIAPRTPFREFGFSVPEYVECSNPRCKNGRFRIWPVIAMACSRVDVTFHKSSVCNGNERSRNPQYRVFTHLPSKERSHTNRMSRSPARQHVSIYSIERARLKLNLLLAKWVEGLKAPSIV